MNSEIIIIIFYVVILFTVACEKKGQEIPFNELSETPTLLLNPNGNTPLAAELSLETRVPVKVSFTVKGEEDFTRSVDNYQTSHKVPIVGLYPSRNNELVITLTDKKDNWATISLFVETDSLPSFFPEVDIEVAKYDQMQEGWTLCEFSLATNTAYLTYPFVVDKQGVVRWFMSVADFNDIVFPFQIKKNGNFLFGHASEIYETDWLGYDINSWAISGFRQDHDIYEKPNGNLLITGNNTAVATVADHIFELNPYGDIVNTWDMRQVLDISRTDLVNDANDWLHLNAVWYSENDDCIVVSGRNQGLMKLTNGGELKWILAPHKGWEMAGVNGSGLDTRDFLLTAVDANGVPYNDQIQQGLMATDDFDWTWGQHAVMVLPNDEVFVFDNGFKRNFLNATTTHMQC